MPKLSKLLEQELVHAGFMTRKFSSEKEYQRQKELEAAQKAMAELDYQYMPALEYCGWLPEDTKEEKRIKKSVQSCHPHCCFNHRVGLPRAVYKDQDTGEVWESDPVEIYDYEREVVERYEKARYYALNKVRGCGITEILAVRHMAYKYAVANVIPNRKCLIMAGTSKSIAVGILSRIVNLLRPFPFLYQEIPRSSNPEILKFRTRGLIYALASSPNSSRGFENVGDVLLDESGFWDLEDDEPVLKANEPFVAKGRANLGAFTTPNGQRGFMWTKIADPDLRTTKYDYHVLTIDEVANVPVPVIDIEEANRLKEEDPDLYAQEFGNKFLLPSSSVFGDKFNRGEKVAEF